MGEFSLTHWLIVLVILLLFFGPSKLPGLGASLGKAIRGFKAGLNEADPNERNTTNTQQAPAQPEQLNSTQTAQSTETNKQKDPHHT